MTTYDPEHWFKSETEAYRYLAEIGVTVSRGKFNQDKNSGLIRHVGKHLSKADVEKYARLLLAKEKVAPANVVAGDLEARRLKADTERAEHEARISRVKADNAERELDDKWLHRDEAYEQLAALLGELVASLHRRMLQAVPTLVHLCGGDPARGPELYDGAEELIATACNDLVSAGRIEGIFDGKGEG